MRVHTKHTLETLAHRCVEEGDCQLWTGYVHNGTPQVFHDGKIMSVRRLILQLQGMEPKKFTGPSCGNSRCVHPEHISNRSKSNHARSMAKRAHEGEAAVRHRVGIQKWRRANPIKLNEETAAAIRTDERSSREVAQAYGISKSMVGKIKRGDYWRDNANPFAALM